MLSSSQQLDLYDLLSLISSSGNIRGGLNDRKKISPIPISKPALKYVDLSSTHTPELSVFGFWDLHLWVHLWFTGWKELASCLQAFCGPKADGTMTSPSKALFLLLFVFYKCFISCLLARTGTTALKHQVKWCQSGQKTKQTNTKGHWVEDRRHHLNSVLFLLRLLY